MRRIKMLQLAFSLLFVTVSSSALASEGLHAGAASVNIDPLKLPILKNGGFTQRTAAKVNDSLFARSLILQNQLDHIAICVVDSCMIDRELCDRAKELAQKQTGIDANRILISATHTHAAPAAMRTLGCPADREYQQFLALKIAESINAATEQLRPAQAGWGVIEAGHMTNPRRWIYLPHKMKTDPYGDVTVRAMMHPGHANPDTAGPSGPEDPDLTLLSIQDRQGQPLAVLGNFSMHYFGRQPLSSDYTGRVCELLEAELQGGIALMSQGTSGDLQHRDYSKPANQGVFAGTEDPFAAYCEELAMLATKAIKGVRYKADIPLGMAESKLKLMRRLPDEARLAWADSVIEKTEGAPGNRSEVLAMESRWIHDNPYEELKLQAIRIGDLGITAIPNEVFGITGLKLKMQSPLPLTMNIELANGATGYIPPPEQHELGGYTTWPARTAGLEVQAEPRIVETLLTLLEDVSGEPRRVPIDAVDSRGRDILDRKPIAWWRMSAHSDNIIVDGTDNGHDAKLEPGYALFLPGPDGGNSTPRGNRAVHFAGGRMVADGIGPSDDYAASFWFWNAMPPGERKVAGYLFSIGSNGSAEGDHLGVSGSASKHPGRLLLYNGNTLRQTLIGDSNLDLRRWYHVLLVRQGETVRIYLDGNPKPEIEGQLADTRPAGSDVFVGGRSDKVFNFEGKIDEVALFNQVLGAEDAAILGSKPETEIDAPKTRPNVMFIGVDDLRPELGCYGAQHILSPNIDRLASEGVLFERAYCQWAVCMPSRASLLSGLRPDTFQGKANRFRQIVPDVVTMPQHFKNHGYFARSFGKIYHGSWETAYVGNSFQDPPSWSAPRWAASPQYYFSPEGIDAARDVFANATPKFLFLGDAKRDSNDPDQWKEFFVRGPATEAPNVPDSVPADGAIADAALTQLRELVAQENPQPFFLAVGFQKPHLPFVAPKRYWDLYDPDAIPPVDVPSPPDGAPEFAIGGLGELKTYSDMPKADLTTEQVRHLRHGYAACVSYVDAQIGRLLDELETLGVRENTIVVVWSDHGYKLGDFGAWCKHTNFELDTRVPLIISAPESTEGATSHALVELVDLHPTLSELAGLPIHEGADGVSFAAVVNDPNTPGEDAAFSQFPKGGYMGYTIRTADHRYTEWRPSKGGSIVAIELYDYKKSSIEKTNVAGSPRYKSVQNAMQKRLHTMTGRKPIR